MDVGAAPEHDEAEGGGEAGAVEHGARDTARGAPWAEVLVDEAEVGRARVVGGWRAGGGGGGRGRARGGRADGGRGERAREGLGGFGRFGGVGEVEAGAGEGVGGRWCWSGRGRRRWWCGRVRRL